MLDTTDNPSIAASAPPVSTPVADADCTPQFAVRSPAARTPPPAAMELGKLETYTRPIPTALLIRILLRDRGVPMSTYGLALELDESLSVKMKTLARDGYIQSAGNRLLRTRMWTLSPTGHYSLDHTSPAKMAKARAVLALRLQPLHRTDLMLLHGMIQESGMTVATLQDYLGFPQAKLRQALARLRDRGFAQQNAGDIWTPTAAGASAVDVPGIAEEFARVRASPKRRRPVGPQRPRLALSTKRARSRRKSSATPDSCNL